MYIMMQPGDDPREALTWLQWVGEVLQDYEQRGIKWLKRKEMKRGDGRGGLPCGCPLEPVAKNR